MTMQIKSKMKVKDKRQRPFLKNKKKTKVVILFIVIVVIIVVVINVNINLPGEAFASTQPSAFLSEGTQRSTCRHTDKMSNPQCLEQQHNNHNPPL